MKWIFNRELDAGDMQGEAAFSQELNRQRGDLGKETSVFVRETISNCADQKVEDNLDPIEAYIDVITLSGASKKEFLEELDWDNLKGHLKSTVTHANSKPSHSEINKGINILKDHRQKIKLVRVSDYNSVGLVGDDDDVTSNFCLFAKSDFLTGDDQGRQGSFGLGKGVLWHRSLINTVLMSSTVNHNGEIQTRSFGKTTLPSHTYMQPDAMNDNPNGRWFGAGYFGIRNQDRYRSDSVFGLDSTVMKKLFLERDDERTGTTVISVAFESDQDANLITALEDDVRKWFWPAISQDRPKIVIAVREFNNHDIVGTPHIIKINENYQPFADCLNNEKNASTLIDEGDIVSKEVEFDVPGRNTSDFDQASIQNLLDEDITGFKGKIEIKALRTNQEHTKINNLVYLRDNLTVVQYKKISSNSVGGFISVCKAGKARGNSIRDEKFHDFLRLAEPALHNNWKYKSKLQKIYQFDNAAAKTRLDELDGLITKTAQDFVNKELEVSEDNLSLLSQKFNFGKGGIGVKDKQLDYEKISHGTLNKKVFIEVEVKNLRDDLSAWKSKIDFKIIGINGNDNNLIIESLDFNSIDNDLISSTFQKRNAYITADRAIERYKVKITAITPGLFSENEIKDLKYSLSINAYAGDR
mgnify:FL=1